MAGNRNLEGKNAVIAGKLLRKTALILNAAGIPYTLEGGTLLGIIRENRFLPWDNDLDITVTSNFEKRLLKNRWRFWIAGYFVRVRYYTRKIKYWEKGEARILKISHRKLITGFRDRVVLEVFLKKLVEDEYFWTVGHDIPVLKSVPRRFYENFTSIEFQGNKYTIPEDYTGYLEEHYGKDWRIPVKEWNFRTSDKSVKEFL